jgi:hypothetical protein
MDFAETIRRMVLTAGALVRVDSLERMQNALAPEGWDKPVRQGIEGIRNFRSNRIRTAARPRGSFRRLRLASSSDLAKLRKQLPLLIHPSSDLKAGAV